MCTIPEFNKRLARNTAQYRKDRKNGKRGFTAKKYVYACGTPLDPITEFNKMPDFAAAIAIGALPYKTTHGVDAVKLINGKLVDIELKVTTVNPVNIRVGPRGGLFIPGRKKSKGNKTALRSLINGQYNIWSIANLASKYVPTYLVAYDSFSGRIIDAYCMNTNQIKSAFMQKYYSTGPMTLKLSTFMLYGQAATTTNPAILIKKFEAALKACGKKVGITNGKFDTKKYSQMIK